MSVLPIEARIPAASNIALPYSSACSPRRSADKMGGQSVPRTAHSRLATTASYSLPHRYILTRCQCTVSHLIWRAGHGTTRRDSRRDQRVLIGFPAAGLALRHTPSHRRFGSWLLIAVPVSLGLLIAFTTSVPLAQMATGGDNYGLWQRALIIEIQVWYVAMGWLTFGDPRTTRRRTPPHPGAPDEFPAARPS